METFLSLETACYGMNEMSEWQYTQLDQNILFITYIRNRIKDGLQDPFGLGERQIMGFRYGLYQLARGNFLFALLDGRDEGARSKGSEHVDYME